ncbi:HDIG domain-containing protein [Enterococcus hirae]|nr:HDIG domain-containing protein [Enterococcus hirae]
MKNIWARLKHKLGKKYPFLLVAVFSLILLGIFYTNVRQKKLNIHEGQVAEETIRANQTKENSAETERRRQLAQEAVPPEYIYNGELKEINLNYIEQLFQLINQVNKESKETSSKTTSSSDAKTAEENPTEKSARLKNKFENLGEDAVAFYQALPEDFYTSIFERSDAELSLIESQATRLVEKYMNKRIRESNLDEMLGNAEEEVQMLSASDEVKRDLDDLLKEGIAVNDVYSEKKTKELQQTARDAVQPVMIYQGEIIVRQDVQIDAKAMEKLKLLGLTNRHSSNLPIYSLIAALAVQAILILTLASHGTKDGRRDLELYTAAVLVSALLMELFHVFHTDRFSYIAQLFPAAFGPLLLNRFASRKMAVVSAMFQSVFVYYVYYSSIGTTFVQVLAILCLFNGLMGTMTIHHKRLNEQFGKTFKWVVLLPITFNLTMILYQGLDVVNEQLIMIFACGFFGTMFAFILSVAAQPYVELLIDDDSQMVLNELSNPNHPLLKELLEKAPGTYHHSMMVANLSANAVAEIGGRSLLTRVSCYYHDIGKIKHPNMFAENLPPGAENPHNYLLPEDSKKIIFSHVTEGVKILKEYQMPQMVIDICQQHHGTTLMQYFYVKAKEQDPNVKESDFRYPGPKPQTREAAVVSIADSCEAAVRSMEQPSYDKIKEFVHSLIQSRIQDGQFAECDISLKELAIVEDSLVSGLASTFHSRIKYPKMITTAPDGTVQLEGES